MSLPRPATSWRALLTACLLPFAATAVAAQDYGDLVARGAYLAQLGDCAACHTAPGGADFAGGLTIRTPLGAIIASNITPSVIHGIGSYSLTQFADALRKGVRGDGARLYPAMPYTDYAGLSDADIAALYAYFRQAVAPVDQSPPTTRLSFPFSLRAGMIGWNWLFLKSVPFTADPEQDATWNRGAYLDKTLGHCGACHTPRNLLQAEQAERAGQGASLGDWYAPNLTGLMSAGWTNDLLLAYLRGGQAVGKLFSAQAAGPMLEVVEKSLSHWTEEDRSALADYLLSQPAAAAVAKPDEARALTSDVALRGEAPASPEKMDGAQLYDAYCATCHQMSGTGVNGLPALLGNRALAGPTADNAVMVILAGVWPQGHQAMPAFAERLSDSQISTLSNYLFAQFGDSKVTITSSHIADLRHGTAASSWLVAAVWAGLAAVVLALAGGIWLLFRRRS